MKRPVRSRLGRHFGAGCCGGWRLDTSGYPIIIQSCLAMRICMRILGGEISWSDTMQDLYDVHAPKKATNLSLNSDLLQKARCLKVNLSATLEQALRDKLKSIEAEKWKKENKAAIAAYNEFVAENGCIGDEYRNF